MGGIRQPDPRNDRAEVQAIVHALDHGLNVLDTAEMYGNGHAEELVAKALKGRDREEIYLITKILPSHLDRAQVERSARQSLARLGVSYVDLYLIHWPPKERIKIAEGIRAMEGLVQEGLVRSIGVSNFNVADMELAMSSAKREEIAANQVEYSLVVRDAEREVIPFCERNGITVISYTPLAEGRVAGLKSVRQVAAKVGKTPIQVALNYLVPRSVPIPKASKIDHLDEVLGSLGWELSREDLGILGAG